MIGTILALGIGSAFFGVIAMICYVIHTLKTDG